MIPLDVWSMSTPPPPVFATQRLKTHSVSASADPESAAIPPPLPIVPLSSNVQFRKEIDDASASTAPPSTAVELFANVQFWIVGSAPLDHNPPPPFSSLPCPSEIVKPSRTAVLFTPLAKTT